MKKIRNWIAVLIIGLPLMLSGCVAAVPVLMAGAVAGAAVGVVTIVNLARDQYPDIDFDKPAPVEVVYADSYDRTWNGVVDTIMELKESTAMMDKNSGIIRTKPKNLNDVSWIGKGIGKATFLYELNITVRKKNKGVSVGVMTPFWEEKVFIAKKEKNIPEGANMVRHIFYNNLNKRLNPVSARNPDSPMHDIRLAPESMPKEYNSSQSISPDQDQEKQPVTETLPPKQNQKKIKKSPDTETLMVQKALIKLGYNPGPADGLIGSKTRKAIRQFQKDSNIKVTGNADSNTLIALGLKEGVVEYTPKKDSDEIESEDIKAVPVKSEETEENMPLIQPDVVEVIEEKTIIGKGKVVETTSLLSEPNFMAEVIREIPVGQLIELLEKNDAFYKVRYKDMEGYIYAEFVDQL